MKRVQDVLLPLMVALVAGCASVPMAPIEADAAAKRFEATPGKANLYVYRNENFGGAVKMSVVLDGAMLGDTAAMTYLFTPVERGHHQVTSKTENDSDVEFDAEEGKTYFLWQEVKMGVWTARSALHPVQEQEGRAAVLQCKLARANTLRPAGCSKDTDCKGERICKTGICVEPPLMTN